MSDAAARWSHALAEHEIPRHILDGAPESPWGFPPSLFKAPVESQPAPDRIPSQRLALEALEPAGTVLDVGAGGGAASIPLAGKASSISAVDESEPMLRAFAAAAEERGVAHREVLGRWPEAAPRAGVCDVVVCHHVFYNVPDLGPFVAALTAAALRRVVVELTAVHPGSSLNHLWRHFHGLERPLGPAYRDAVAVLEAMGVDVRQEVWQRPGRGTTTSLEEIVPFIRRRLCLPESRDAELEELIGDQTVWSPREVVTLWWDAGG